MLRGGHNRRVPYFAITTSWCRSTSSPLCEQHIQAICLPLICCQHWLTDRPKSFCDVLRAAGCGHGEPHKSLDKTFTNVPFKSSLYLLFYSLICGMTDKVHSDTALHCLLFLREIFQLSCACLQPSCKLPSWELLSLLARAPGIKEKLYPHKTILNDTVIVRLAPINACVHIDVHRKFGQRIIVSDWWRSRNVECYAMACDCPPHYHPVFDYSQLLATTVLDFHLSVAVQSTAAHHCRCGIYHCLPSIQKHHYQLSP